MKSTKKLVFKAGYEFWHEGKVFASNAFQVRFESTDHIARFMPDRQLRIDGSLIGMFDPHMMLGKKLAEDAEEVKQALEHTGKFPPDAELIYTLTPVKTP